MDSIDSELRRDTQRAMLVSEQAAAGVASLKDEVATGEQTGGWVGGWVGQE